MSTHLRIGSYGTPSKSQQQVIVDSVKGRRGIDIGAGGYELTGWLLRHGAGHVTAIDKDLPDRAFDIDGIRNLPPCEDTQGRLTTFRGYYQSYLTRHPDARFDVGFVSWPSVAVLRGLVALLERCETVIYLGKNTDGTACGFPGLFQHLLGRELLSYKADSANCLVVAGAALPDGRRRLPTGEELAGLECNNADRHIFFRQAERLARDATRRQALPESGA